MHSRQPMAFHRIDLNIHDKEHIDGLVQDCSNSIAIALELPQSCAKPSIHITAAVESYYNATKYNTMLPIT